MGTAVIGVENCGDSYAYDLQGVPKCDARYCMTASVAVASLDEPLYGVPTNYEQFVVSDASIAVSNDDREDVFELILSLLLIILLILCLFLFFLLVWICCVVRPLYKNKKLQ